MSTLSANQLPAKRIPSRVSMNHVEDFLIHTTGSGANATTELTLDVIVNNSRNQTVELGMWLATDLQGPSFPPPASVMPVSKQTFALVEGRQSRTFQLLNSTHANLHGTQAQQVVMVLYIAPNFVLPSARFRLDDQPDKCDRGVGLEPLFSGKWPQYDGDEALAPAHYPGWSRLIQNQQFERLERIIIAAVAGSEGKLDAVQSADSEVVSVGCIQKTLPKEAYKNNRIVSDDGELAEQLWKFKQDEPVRFACLLQTPPGGGWDVTNPSSGVYRIKFTDPDTRIVYSRGQQGASNNLIELRKLIHKIHTDGTHNTKRHNRILDPLVRLGQDEAFQERQLLDARDRLRGKLSRHPYGRDTSKPLGKQYYTDKSDYEFPYPVSDYIKSDIGRAYILNQDVNRPSQTLYYIGAALDDFFHMRWGSANKLPPAPDQNPANWPNTPDPYPTYGSVTVRERYERELIKLYAQSIYDAIDIYIYDGVTAASHSGVFAGRYGHQRKFFEDSKHNVAWLPEQPRPARERESKRKK